MQHALYIHILYKLCLPDDFTISIIFHKRTYPHYTRIFVISAHIWWKTVWRFSPYVYNHDGAFQCERTHWRCGNMLIIKVYIYTFIGFLCFRANAGGKLLKLCRRTYAHVWRFCVFDAPPNVKCRYEPGGGIYFRYWAVTIFMLWLGICQMYKCLRVFAHI